MAITDTHKKMSCNKQNNTSIQPASLLFPINSVQAMGLGVQQEWKGTKNQILKDTGKEDSL